MLSHVCILLCIVAVNAIPTKENGCPTGCNCTEISANCDTLNIPTFNKEITNIKIVKAKEPLILKNGVFKLLGLGSIDSIQIEDATILEMDKTAFENLPRLLSIEILNANIITADPNAFGICTKLRKLKIAKTKFQQPLLIKSKTIQELELPDCGLYEITNKTFANLPKLTYLNIANNHINYIEKDAFSSLPFLEEIIMSNNNIMKLPQFEKNTKLFSLDLSNNPLEDFDFPNSTIEKIVLNSCNLKRFNLTEKSYDVLSYLDLSNNSINSLNLHLDNLIGLEFIDLSNNQLKEINGNLFNSNCNLLKIILDNNNIEILPNFMCKSGYWHTYRFSCKNCSLKSISENTFAYFRALVTLDLSNNHLQGHHLKPLQDLPSLINLDLSYNNISTIESFILSRSSSLEKLNLAGNPIKIFDPSVLNGNRAIKSLDLSSCQLRQMWKDGAAKLSSLHNLNIANNEISIITTKDLTITENLQIFDISGNTLKCTKDINEIIQWLTNHRVVPATQSERVSTHASLKLEAVSFESKEEGNVWKNLADSACSDDYYNDDDDDDDDDDEDEEDEDSSIDDIDATAKGISLHDIISARTQNYPVDDDNNYEYYEEDTLINERVRQVEGILRHKHFSLLWPSMVFIFTALLVLVIAANIMLLFLRKRETSRHLNLPHIKIPQWNVTKMKKHSGSIYQPLTEENEIGNTVTRYQIGNQLPSVHNSNQI